MPRLSRFLPVYLPLFLSFLFLAAGCQSPGYRPDPQKTLREKVNLSSGTAQVLDVVDVREVVENGLLRVQVRFDNRAGARRSFRTLFEWFDARGMKVDSANEGWSAHIIRAGQELVVTGTATDPDVADWTMQVGSWDR